VVTRETKVLEANALPPRRSAQWAELYALIQALTLGQRKHINIYTDSCYAFAKVHVHRATIRRGLFTAAEMTIKNKEEILHLLKAIWLPKEVAVLHHRGHQKGDNPVTQGNRLADETAKMAAIQEYKENPTLAAATISEELHLDYTIKKEWTKQERANQLKGS
jgi:ribonuclease HI